MKVYTSLIGQLIESQGLIVEEFNNDHLNKAPISQETRKEASDTFLSLGGLSEKPPKFFRYPDLVVRKKWLLVDFELDFNRYRKITLQKPLYKANEIVNVEDYLRYCRQNEADCIKSGSAGDFWSNNLAEKYFGSSDEPGDLGRRGSAQWKLRAYGNFLTDLISMSQKKELVRISIYDSVLVGGSLKTVKDLCLSGKSEYKNALKNHVNRKLNFLQKSE